MGNLISQIKTSADNVLHIKLNKQIQLIRQITNNLLKDNRKLINAQSENASYYILQELLKDIVLSKSIEWNVNIISYQLQDSIIWVKVIESEFKRIISNLLNNSYEALTFCNKPQIVVNCHEINDIIKITIEDNGKGINSHKLKQIKFSSVSFKPLGNGIGIYYAIKYVSSLNGKLDIQSMEGVGTKLSIHIPKINAPSWFSDVIHLDHEANIIIIDNDLDILSFWQKKLIGFHLMVQYFTDCQEFLDWFSTNNSNCLIITDYDLGVGKMNGLELLKQVNVMPSYVITDYADHHFLQEEIKLTKNYLIPKSILKQISIRIMGNS